MGPRSAMVVGAWWMMREVELSTMRAALVTLTGDWSRTSLGARLTLPASKNDAAALGAARAHRCHCLSAVLPLCPTHAIADQIAFLALTFPHRFRNGMPDFDLPLFPDAYGNAVSKQAMVETILFAARWLGVQDLRDGAQRVSGHSLRCTGAQGLIQLCI